MKPINNLRRIISEETYRSETEPVTGESRENVNGVPIDYWITPSGKHEKCPECKIYKTETTNNATTNI